MRKEPSSQFPWLPRVIRWVRDRPEKIWNWIKKIWDWYRFPVSLLAIALVSYLGVLIYQACGPNKEARYQGWVTEGISEGYVLLSVAYPRKLRLESPPEARAISVWLQQVTPTPTPTPTPSPTGTVMCTSTTTPTPTCVVTPELTRTATLTSASTSTPATVPTSTSTATPRPWVVSFSPHNTGILFVDREGVPVAPQVVLTPGSKSAAPAVLYAQRAPLAKPSPSVSLTMSVYGPEVTSVHSQALPSSVGLERPFGAGWRHFRDLLCGPTTPLLMFAGSVVAFAAREWQRRSELEREERKRRILAEVELLANLASQPKRMIERYWELEERTGSEPEWNDQEVIRCLRETLKEHLELQSLLTATEHWFGEFHDDRAYRCIQLALRWWDEENEEVQAFRRVLKYLQSGRRTEDRLPEEEAQEVARGLGRLGQVCGEKTGDRVSRLLIDLRKKQDWKEEQLKDFAIAEKTLRWLNLWPSTRPADPGEVLDWLQLTDFEFNPFGPESAELDPWLPEYYVRGDVFKRIGGRRPITVLGATGSGKTAAALLLAYDCQDPPARPREQGAFPVYCSLPIGATSTTLQGNHLTTIIQEAARSVTRCVTHRPEGFLELPESDKHGIVRLLSLCTDSSDLLEARLRHNAPRSGTSSILAREMVAMHQPISYEREIAHTRSRASVPGLLSEALPRTFECMYLILDLSVASGASDTVARDVHYLLDRVIPMAAKGVYMKLFLPAALRPYLCNTSACEVVTLTWTEDALHQMIDDRTGAADSEKKQTSLDVLCGPSVPKKPSLTTRLAQAADGSPRRLVCLGNQLLLAHARRAPEQPQLSASEIDRVLGAGDKR